MAVIGPVGREKERGGSEGYERKYTVVVGLTNQHAARVNCG